MCGVCVVNIKNIHLAFSLNLITVFIQQDGDYACTCILGYNIVMSHIKKWIPLSLPHSLCSTLN